MMEKIIFIDRDGVINVDPIGDYIKRWADFRFEEGALEGMKILSRHGYDIIVISNQAGIGDGVYTLADLHDINENMIKVFEKEGIRFKAAYYCEHGKAAGCSCRKPEIGLFQRAVADVSYDPKTTFFIGDKISDVLAGKKFGIRTIFVKTGHGKYEEKLLTKETMPDFICDSLKHAVETIVQ